MLRVELDSLAARDAFGALIAAGADMTPVMKTIGEGLSESTKARFRTATAPDGERWLPNSRVTIERYIGDFATAFSKRTGKLTKSGATRVATKQPLTGITRALRETISTIADAQSVEIGSPMIYANTQQVGAAKHSHQGGKTPWGDIPARPFLGLSSDDEQLMRDAVLDYLDAQI